MKKIFIILCFSILGCEMKVENNISISECNIDKNIDLKKIENCALIGHRDRQFDLAMAYLNGNGVEKDIEKSFYWMSKSADKGLSGAQNMMAWYYRTGTIVEQNDTKAFYWVQKAADSGSINAKNNLAFYYQNGIGVNQDMKKSFELFEEAAHFGNESAQKNLGFAYLNGYGIEPNLNLALKWMIKPAEKGDTEAMINVAYIYKKMNNPQKELMWMEKSASYGNPLAQTNLSYMYLMGSGIEKNKDKALFWINKALEQDYPYAYFLMGKFYSDGDSFITDDKKIACDFFLKAIELGFTDATNEIVNINCGVK